MHANATALRSHLIAAFALLLLVPGALAAPALDIPAEGAPTVDLVVHEDPVSGWNLELRTANLFLKPELAGTTHVMGEGHALLLVDGAERMRLYGAWTHLPPLPPGEHELTAVLTTNDLQQYSISGAPISDTEYVTAPGAAPAPKKPDFAPFISVLAGAAGFVIGFALRHAAARKRRSHASEERPRRRSTK